MSEPENFSSQSLPAAGEQPGAATLLDQNLATTESALARFKQLYQRLQQEQAQSQVSPEQQAHLKTELEQIQEQLVVMAMELASQLPGWHEDAGQNFWQVLRYGGLGFVLALLLHTVLH